MKTKNIIWGFILVLIGTLFILKNLDIIYFSWYSIWKLWPLVLVMIGVTILPVKDGIKVALALIVLIAAALFLVYYPGFHGKNDDTSVNISRDNSGDKDSKEIDQRIFEKYDSTVTEANLAFDAAAGDFTINQPTDELFEFEKDGNLGRYTYSIQDLGRKKDINIKLEEGRIFKTNLKNKVTIKLNPKPDWDIKVDVGAADVELDLSLFKIRKLDIDGGASSIDLRLGTLQAESKIKINSGASSINIKVPREFACEVNTSTVLSSKDLAGFNKVGNGTYVTPDFSEKSKNIIIDVEAAVSSLNVERY
jgi:uncharacterized membrane protein